MKAHNVLLAAFLGLTIVASAFAHHSNLLQITTDRVQIEGVVTRIEWANPHVFVYIDAKDPADSSKIVNWSIETGSPKECTAKGLAKTDLKIGSVVTLKGAQRRIESRRLEVSPSDISWPGKPLQTAKAGV